MFQNDVAVASTSLAAGTYWLVLHDGLSSNTDFQDFYFAWTNVNPTNTASTRGKEQSLVPASVTWDATGQEHAFFISGTSSATPEPGSILLLSGGLAVLLLARKRVSA